MTPTLLALIVDRDPDTRLMYAEYLRGIGYDTDEAEDGREALAKALTSCPRVVVTDTRLPGLSGLDLCRLLRSDVATQEGAIIFVTGEAHDEELARAQAAGADVVLVKPCLPERLTNAIRDIVAQRQIGRTAQIPPPNTTRSHALAGESGDEVRREILSHTHRRRDTTEPDAPPPMLMCPECDEPLRYLKSHVGGVSARHGEQWDDFECSRGCGTYQYRQRTRRVRRVS